MYCYTHQLRTRYSETDQMGFVYHGNYAAFLEVGRTESIRHLGIHYKELEKKGILMPVLDIQMKFIKPVVYDELISIKTCVVKPPMVKMEFSYEIRKENDELAVKAHTTLFFLKKENLMPTPCPLYVREKLKPFFE